MNTYDVEELAINSDCPRCGIKRGDTCVDGRGEKMPRAHVQRVIRGHVETTAKLMKENQALSKVYATAAGLRTFPVPFEDHGALVDAVDTCRQELHDLEHAGPDNPRPVSSRCPHCQAGDPSVWDGVLFHYAHPAPNDKLKFCHEPWRERCRACSADLIPEGVCGAACGFQHGDQYR